METNVTIQIPEVDKHVQDLVRKAYELGIEEGRTKLDYPALLTKEDLKGIFQVEVSAVNKLIEKPTFPKFKLIRARYPRDLVFEWIKENSSNIVNSSRHKES
ncbi:hypothetical protein [Paenibacillus silvae]|uniref:DNA-binding protein n=1 Tax=Paenibacillus silvae TaxID=1325358 RepID=A0A2W6N7X6_9BACL|nr:hypothetical protein [Paenibacillus silvae]PZT51984.1 hypothetical protein DN757_29600 [Paenibacillus silvae]